MTLRYYEEFAPEESYDLGTTTVSEAEIISFAEQYDPQEFHTDPEAAASTQFGQLFASGWHTASLCMRQLVDELFYETAVVGGVGVNELRWLCPLYAGDTLRVSGTVTETSDWDEQRGLVTFAIDASNQHGDTVIRFEDLALIQRADA